MTNDLLIRSARIAFSTVSGGGTPNAWRAHDIAGLTEVRVGTDTP